MSELLNTVIIGSGPAGLTAAIYTARAALHPVVLAGSTPGGQLTKTSLVENYPGFAKGIDGPQLMMDMLEQAQWCGAQVKYESAIRIAPQSDGSILVVDGSGAEYRSRSLIYATGAKPRMLGSPGEEVFQPPKGHGVTYCAVCDGNFFRKMPVAVIGGGDSAMEEACYLSKICSEVTLIHRRDEFRASKVMVDRARSTANIKWELFQTVEEVMGDREKVEVTGLRLKNTKDGSSKELPVKGVFVAIGHIPTTDVLKGVVEMDEEGYIKVDRHQKTSAPGIFAAGDCHDRRYRQAVTAAGMGCAAALEVERFLGGH